MKENEIELTKIADRKKQIDMLFVLFADELTNKQFFVIEERIVSSYLNEVQGDEYNALIQTQQLFEAVAEENITAALCLLTELYNRAAEIRAHDIADSIDLWIDAEGNEDVLSYIISQYELPNKSIMRKVYDDWISTIKENLKK